MGFRDAIEDYANQFWMIPCRDGFVCTNYTRIMISNETGRLKLNSGEWSGVFLRYATDANHRSEGLYLVKTTSLARARTGSLDCELYPERIMLSAWPDDSWSMHNKEVQSQKLLNSTIYHGLNDCAHFATQALAAGQIHVETTGAPELFAALSSMGQAKVLAMAVPQDVAGRIIDSDIMKTGDVLIYSKTATDHHHSAIYLGCGKIATHTFANHPSHGTFRGDWKISADHRHPLVTLFHFGLDDKRAVLARMLVGWWKVEQQGSGTYYFYFRDNGVAGWTSRAPASVNQPIGNAQGTGYWFEQDMSILVCWTETGVFEKYNSVSPANASSFTGQVFDSLGTHDRTMNKLM